MQIIYSQQDPPKSWKHAVFLAGPTPRDSETPSWRPEALKLLEELGYDGVVFVPEFDGSWRGSYIDQTEWEQKCMNMADTILFWVPRDLRVLPGFSTNIEFGRFIGTGKIVFGRPEGAPKTQYLDWLAGTEKTPVYNTLKETIVASVDGWGTHPKRTDGERYVPANVFETDMFQSWYQKQIEDGVGNRLDEAKVLWSFRLPKKTKPFSYVLWVKIWIASENRYKENEFVFARTDVATTVLYYHPNDELLDTQVILVREFRSPARTSDGFIHELPGEVVKAGMIPLGIGQAGKCMKKLDWLSPKIDWCPLVPGKV